MTGAEYNHINDVIEDLYEDGKLSEEDFDNLCKWIDEADKFEQKKKNEAEWKVIWNMSVEPIEKVFICSNCDKNTTAFTYRRRFNYCPDCGAKMEDVSE